MPDRRQNVAAYFNRSYLRTKIESLSFRDAQRLRGPLYDVLLKELFEENCTITAKYFQCLTRKEKSLILQNIIDIEVCSEPEFLMKLVDNFKLAELSAKLRKGGGMLASLKIMYQCMLLVESNRSKFNWLVADIYDIVIRLMKGLDENEVCFSEIKMRIYYKYGCYLDSEGKRLERAIFYLEKAFELTKGEVWEPDSSPEIENFKTMFEAIPQTLATIILKQAERVLKTNPEESLDLSNRAVVILSSVSWKENKLLACKAILSKINHLIECKKYDMALSQSRKLYTFLEREKGRTEFIPLHCTLNWYMGFCHYSLNELSKAIKYLRIAHFIAHTHQLNELEANILVTIGRTYGKNPENINAAITAYTVAKEMFCTLNETGEHMKTKYLMAKLQADKIFPEFLSMLKSRDYCQYYNLLQWKNLRRPFWHLDPVIKKEKSISSIKTVLLVDETPNQEERFVEIERTIDDDIGSKEEVVENALEEDEENIQDFLPMNKDSGIFRWHARNFSTARETLYCLLRPDE